MAANGSVLATLVDELITLEFGDIDDEARVAAAAFVLTRARCAGAVTRAGLALGAMALEVACLAATRRRFAHLDQRSRARLVQRLAGAAPPLVGEYVRLVRSLVLVHVFESRPGARRSAVASA